MPRRQTIPSYRLHKPSGQARVIIDGRHIYLGPYGSDESKAEYERLVRKLLTDRAAAELAARVQVSNDLMVAELAVKYLEFARTYYVKNGRPNPEYDHICSAMRPVIQRHGAELVTAFGPLKLKAIRQAWIDQELDPETHSRAGRGRSPTIHDRLSWTRRVVLEDVRVATEWRYRRGSSRFPLRSVR